MLDHPDARASSRSSATKCSDIATPPALSTRWVNGFGGVNILTRRCNMTALHWSAYDCGRPNVPLLTFEDVVLRRQLKGVRAKATAGGGDHKKRGSSADGP